VKHEQAFKIAEAIFGSWKSSGFDPHVKYPVPPFEPMKKSVAFVKESSIAQAPLMIFHGRAHRTYGILQLPWLPMFLAV
jgi:zinc protease